MPSASILGDASSVATAFVVIMGALALLMRGGKWLFRLIDSLDNIGHTLEQMTERIERLEKTVGISTIIAQPSHHDTPSQTAQDAVH